MVEPTKICGRWVAAARLMGMALELIDSDWCVSADDFERLREDRERARAEALEKRKQAKAQLIATRQSLQAQRKQADKDLQAELWGRYSDLVHGDDVPALEAFCAEMARERPRYHDGVFVFAVDPTPSEALRKAMHLALTLVGQGTHRDSAINIAAKRMGLDPHLLSFAYFQRMGRLKHNRRKRCTPAEEAAMVQARKKRKEARTIWHIETVGPRFGSTPPSPSTGK